MVGDKKNFRLLIQILLTVIVHKEAKFYLKLAILYFLKIQYSREQKHVSFSDTPHWFCYVVTGHWFIFLAILSFYSEYKAIAMKL